MQSSVYPLTIYKKDLYTTVYLVVLFQKVDGYLFDPDPFFSNGTKGDGNFFGQNVCFTLTY